MAKAAILDRLLIDFVWIMDYFIASILPSVRRCPGPMHIPWPGTPSGIRTVATFAEWRQLVLDLDLPPSIPSIISESYRYALKLYLMGWIDGGMIKAGDLIGLATLESALRDRYGHLIPRTPKQIRNRWLPGLSDFIAYMVKHDGVSDGKLSMINTYGGSVMGVLDGTREPSLVDIRNDHSHGYPFSPHFAGGTLHLVRDLILYAYREMISVAQK